MYRNKPRVPDVQTHERACMINQWVHVVLCAELLYTSVGLEYSLERSRCPGLYSVKYMQYIPNIGFCTMECKLHMFEIFKVKIIEMKYFVMSQLLYTLDTWHSNTVHYQRHVVTIIHPELL